MRYLVAALLLVLAGLADTVAPAAELEAARAAGIVVPRAVGVAALGADKVETRQIAIVDCQRNAIEAGLGVMVRSETRVEEYQLVADKIDVRALDGFVFDFQITSEYEKEDLYVVEASCRVGTMPMVQQLANDFPDLYEQLERPRVAILFTETEGGQTAETLVAMTLKERGVEVVERAQIEALGLRDQAAQAAIGDAGAMAAIAAQLNCELQISGSSEKTAEGYTLAARMFNMWDARIVGAQVARGATPEAAVAGLLPGADSPDDLLVQMLGRWLADPTILTCVVTRLPYAQAMRLVRGIQAHSRPTRIELGQVTASEASSIPPIGESTLRNFSTAVSRIEIRTPLRRDQAIEFLANVMGGLGYEIAGVNGLRIDLAPAQTQSQGAGGQTQGQG